MQEIFILEMHLKLINFLMKKIANINEKIKKFNKKIYVPGDKSLSIRWILMASQAIG